MPVWDHFQAFAQTVCRVADETVTDEARRRAIKDIFTPILTPEGATYGPDVLTQYFDEPAAHVVAVNTLDHTQFLHPMRFGAHTVPLREILDEFSRISPQAHGQVWLPLLDLAQEANPGQIKAAAGRDYIRQQMRLTDGPVGLPNLPNSAQLEGILGSVLHAFPGLRDCVGNLMNAGTNAGETDLNGVVDQVQNVLLGPLLQNLRSTAPGAPDISPAINQILDGFRGLNAAIATPVAPDAADGGGGVMEQ